MSKILIAIPTFENIMPETFKSIYDLDSCGNELSFEFVKGYDCARARNDIVRMALEGGFDYIFMVDADMYVPKDALQKMLEYPTEICLGLCPRKNTKVGKTCIYKIGQINYEDAYTYYDLPKQDRVMVHGGGLACALIQTDIFKNLTYPWFRYVTYQNGSELSEDLYFCSQAKANGYKIYVDTRVRCGHATRYFQFE
jgi:glycosyltransferase involved in cell wall biosynthesis